MKKLKQAGFKIAIVLAVIIYGFPLVTCFAGKSFKIPMHQAAENISSIELLDTSIKPATVLKILDETETDDFLTVFCSLRAGKYINDPPVKYGILTVKITYQDGATDFIGSDMNAYFLATGETHGTGWYYIGREEMLDLFEKYVDPALLPKSDTRLD